MPAYYASSVREFLNASFRTVSDTLVERNVGYGFSTLQAATFKSWRKILRSLSRALQSVCKEFPRAAGWGLLLEFPIPRRQRRIDAVILARDIILILEFKTGKTVVSARRQVEDYALDLAAFHEPSHGRTIVPFVISDTARDVIPPRVEDQVQPVARVSANRMGPAILETFRLHTDRSRTPINWNSWNAGAYRPIPTIIDAATALFSGISIREILHSHSGLQNLTKTTNFVTNAVSRAKRRKEKLICFVTGVPGAGKTLVGLNLAHSSKIRGKKGPASVFMSGNGPLIKVLRKTLLRDYVRRNRRIKSNLKNKPSRKANRKSKSESQQYVEGLIQNIHEFVKANLHKRRLPPPHEHAIVFDEAQRAWSAEQNAKKYSDRPSTWHVSEPELVLRIMDRHQDWAVVVALVGGGQEIHEGEAGLKAWGEALQNSFPKWRILAAPQALKGGESVAGPTLFGGNARPINLTCRSVLHLRTSERSYRAKAIAEWVNFVLTGKKEKAAEISKKFERFPVVMTRDLAIAREWLNRNTRGERRCGLVASSGATRLRAFGLETSIGFRRGYKYEHWFLQEPEDVRSCFQLEVPATEFEIQGLELDYVGVCWGGDFVWNNASKECQISEFSPAKWRLLNSPELRQRTINKYRVLLTRAREGLLIWVPRGNDIDPTLRRAEMDETAAYLQFCGCSTVD